jgi:hypothetical protein
MKQRQQSEALMAVKNFGKYVPVFRTKRFSTACREQLWKTHTDDGGSKSFRNMVTVYIALTFMGPCIVIIF